jgi:hypothetical protein
MENKKSKKILNKSKISLIKISDLNLPHMNKNLVKEMTLYRKMTKRLMMNDYFNCLDPLPRRLARTKYFEEVLDNPDWSNWSNKPTATIKKLNLRDLDYIHCLHAPKPIRKQRDENNNSKPAFNYCTSTSGNGENQVTNYNTTYTTANLSELFNTNNPFDIFSKFPEFNNNQKKDGTIKKKDKDGNITSITNTTKTNNYNINLLPFIPIKLESQPGEKTRFFAYKLAEENPGQINIYYYYIRDYKFLICDKSKFLSQEMTAAEKESLYNTIIDSASLGIDQMINNDTYQYTEEDDKLLEELRNGDLLSKW